MPEVSTIDQRVRLMLGDMILQHTALQIENEQLKARIAELDPPKVKSETPLDLPEQTKTLAPKNKSS